MKADITNVIRVYGIVQGVGFRPTVSRHAAECGVRGSVCNKGPYVEILAQGREEQVERFLDALKTKPPKRAAILKIDVKNIEMPRFDEFSIIESEKTKGEIFISPDIAICDDCKRELYDKKDRRYLHPFINCTCCGPRLTILDALPYDRERTSMKDFPMCRDCAEEYHSPETRRYDAQPVCCNDCGPEVYLIGTEKRGREAITYTRRVISSGGIAAVKGIGGFHLCCDASNEDAVSRLRKLKTRPAKPFAVMMKDENTVKRECKLTCEQETILSGHQKPIILLERKAGGKVCGLVAPGNPKIGVMLPYAPVQMLLFDYDDEIEMPDVLVMTSGNVSGAPICRDDNDALNELTNLCDCVLSHDRKIRIRADDSVMDFFRGEPYMIRRSRGYAPLPILLSGNFEGNVLAIGGELKNTFCIGANNQFYPSPYVGDLADLRTVKALEETIDRFKTLLEAEPTIVACDLHPKYNSTAAAKEMGLPLFRVQHHYAHVLSCMAENDYSEPVLGVSFDGTGYGADGTIWGGEILAADLDNFERIGSISPFMQTGGDASAKEGWRIAVSLIHGFSADKQSALEIVRNLKLCTDAEAKVQMTMADRRINSVVSTSAGRLFDGISAILGIRRSSTFEGESSTALQFAAESFEKSGKSHMNIDIPLIRETDGKMLLATDDLAAAIVKARLNGAEADELAYFFHAKLAEQIVAACVRARELTCIDTAALSGGVYQNGLLLKLTVIELEKQGFKVLTHSLIPPNDGGIALGQAAAAMRFINKNRVKL